MKSLYLFVVLSIFGLAISTTYNGYIINYEKTGSMKQQNNNEQISDNDIVHLLKHNFGIQQLDPDHTTKNVIQKYGKGDLLQHVAMNYQIIIEGVDNFEVQQKIVQNRVPVQIDFDQNTKSKIFDKIFDLKKPDSLISQTKQLYKIQSQRIPFYLYSSEPLLNEYFEKYGIALTSRDYNNKSMWQLFDYGTLHPVGTQFNFQDCLKTEFRDVYSFNLQDNTIYKINSSYKIKITSQNEKSINTFLKDVCVVSKTSKMFLHEEPVNFITFYITSLSDLEKTLSAQDLEFVYDMLKLAIKNTVQNFANHFGESDTFGEIVFIGNNSLQTLVEEDKHYMSQNAFSQINAYEKNNGTTTSRRRTLLQDYQPTDSQSIAYNLKWWFAFFIGFIILFTYLGVATMDIQKDTLLYAKFITGDMNK